MKKDKKGFTLVELLAVIVVLAIIMSIAGSALLGQRKKANIEEAKKMERDLKALGVEVYLIEKDNPDIYRTKYYLDYLNSKGLLKSSTIKNPSGNGTCEGYLKIDETANGPKFTGHICCIGVYKTNSNDAPTNCNNY